MIRGESIQAIREKLKAGPAPEELAVWRQDSRAGVRKLLEAYERKQAARAAERERLDRLQDLERAFWEKSLEQVAGCDEAGRGPLAGPLVTAAVILPHTIWLPGLNDSKKVTAARRETLYQEILEQAVSVTVSILGPREIDRLNIYQAAKKAMTLCLTHLKVRPQAAITDAMPLEIPGMAVEDLVHGDSKSAAVAAASIIAKVTRDHLMQELDSQYPQFGFAQHKGYGTAQHIQAILDCGPCPWHRRSYEPLKSMGLKEPAVSENQIMKLK
ncbi:ribonuclease HII [Acidaminococcus massiliensis]|uniref:ribonuclease HII n=1 Tax=Acidaminococcus massiliensis TaxID=1852375 RepID=UPI0026DD95F5|nr:ribonuclease HII [Acidaminococcus massiliensis]